MRNLVLILFLIAGTAYSQMAFSFRDPAFLGAVKPKAQSILPLPIVAFSADATEVFDGDTVTFANSTTGATSYKWLFGDGGTSTLSDPTYDYSNPYSSNLQFSVTLNATNSQGLGTFLTKTNYITAAPWIGVSLAQYWWVEGSTFNAASQILTSDFNFNNLYYYEENAGEVYKAGETDPASNASMRVDNDQSGNAMFASSMLNNPMTFNMWVNISQNTDVARWVFRLGSSLSLYFSGSGDEMVFESDSLVGLSGGTDFPFDTWNMLTVTISGSTAKLYINSVLKATVTCSFSDAGMVIANSQDGDGNCCSGYYADIAIWNRAYDDWSVGQLYIRYPLQNYY